MSAKQVLNFSESSGFQENMNFSYLSKLRIEWKDHIENFYFVKKKGNVKKDDIFQVYGKLL
jgi:uncharacterized protein YnzC (UPF0291/DUF896 family)